MNLFDNEIVLEDNKALLRPLKPEDDGILKSVAFDAEIWKYIPYKVSDENELKDMIQKLLDEKSAKTRYPFIIFDKELNTAAGSTTYMNISFPDKRLEIGSTWLGRDFQKTGLNRHCKLLLLNFAFEELGIVRVEFKTDFLNEKSRNALLKIGAKEEGVLRSHTLMHDGRRRDTIYYSILSNEWETVKNEFFKGI